MSFKSKNLVVVFILAIPQVDEFTYHGLKRNMSELMKLLSEERSLIYNLLLLFIAILIL